MVSSRIEQKIEDIYAFVESCKPQALSQSKVVVPKNDLYDLLDDLRRDVPEEITRYQKMLSQMPFWRMLRQKRMRSSWMRRSSTKQW